MPYIFPHSLHSYSFLSLNPKPFHFVMSYRTTYTTPQQLIIVIPSQCHAPHPPLWFHCHSTFIFTSSTITPLILQSVHTFSAHARLITQVTLNFLYTQYSYIVKDKSAWVRLLLYGIPVISVFRCADSNYKWKIDCLVMKKKACR